MPATWLLLARCLQRYWRPLCRPPHHFLEIADSMLKQTRIWARPMTVPAGPFTPTLFNDEDAGTSVSEPTGMQMTRS
jgi:hypothetical protein